MRKVRRQSKRQRMKATFEGLLRDIFRHASLGEVLWMVIMTLLSVYQRRQGQGESRRRRGNAHCIGTIFKKIYIFLYAIMLKMY